jgi:lipopolysaccharide transport system permease protein
MSVATETQPIAPATSGGDDLPLTVIERSPSWRILDLRELWRFRELLYFLTWRDIKVRYKQTALGVLWAIIQPLATMAAFTLFLGQTSGVVQNLDYPYSLFVLAGLLPWMFFGGSVSSAGQSIVANQNLVTKVYFPRLVIPFSAIGVSLLDFLIGFAMLLILMACHGVWPGPGILWAPLIIVLLMTAAFGVGTLLAALTVAYRDFRFVVPFMVQFWMFATPSIYMQADRILGDGGQALMSLNPAYGLIVNFRQAVLGGPMDFVALTVSGTVSMVLLMLGCFYFRRVERGFADII